LSIYLHHEESCTQPPGAHGEEKIPVGLKSAWSHVEKKGGSTLQEKKEKAVKPKFPSQGKERKYRTSGTKIGL